MSRLLSVFLLLLTGLCRGQSFNGKSLRWEMPPALRDSRCELVFGSGGFGMGTEEVTVRMENRHSKKLYATVVVRVTDNCGTSKELRFNRSAGPGKTAGESLFFDGIGLGTACRTFRTYGQSFRTVIASVEIVSVVVTEEGGSSGSDGPGAGGANSGHAGSTGGNSTGNAGATAGSGNSDLRPCRAAQPALNEPGGTSCVSLRWNCDVPTNTMSGNTLRQMNPVNEWTVQWRKKGATGWQESFVYGCPQVRFTIGGLDACTDYETRLITLCKGQPTITGPITTFTTACPAPSAPQPVDQLPGKVRLRVLQPTGVAACASRPLSSYTIEIQYKPANDAQWLVLTCGGNSSRDCLLENLKAGTQYMVRARTRFANGAYSVFSKVEYFVSMAGK